MAERKISPVAEAELRCPCLRNTSEHKALPTEQGLMVDSPAWDGPALVPWLSPAPGPGVHGSP